MLSAGSHIFGQQARTCSRRLISTSRSLSGWCVYDRRSSSRRDQVRWSVATRRHTNRQDLSLQLAVLLWLWFRCCARLSVSVHPKQQSHRGEPKLTLVVLLHIEPPQQHDRFLTEQASIDRISRIDTLVHVNGHDAASAAETIVQAAEVNAADTELAKSRSAHDAGLNRHVEVGGVQNGRMVAGHDLAESDELGVASAL